MHVAPRTGEFIIGFAFPAHASAGTMALSCIRCESPYDETLGGRQLPCQCVACEKCVFAVIQQAVAELGDPKVIDAVAASGAGPYCPRCWSGHRLERLVFLWRELGAQAAEAFRAEVPAVSVRQAWMMDRRPVFLPHEWLSPLGRALSGKGTAMVREATLTWGDQRLPVAVKELRIDPNHRRAFQEGALSTRVSRQCDLVCKTYGVVFLRDVFYLVMELCQKSLLARLREVGSGGLPERELARLALGLFASLGQLHRCSVMHCDIKPANCLLRADGTVVLADFGGSKVTLRPAGVARHTQRSWQSCPDSDEAAPFSCTPGRQLDGHQHIFCDRAVRLSCAAQCQAGDAARCAGAWQGSRAATAAALLRTVATAAPCSNLQRPPRSPRPRADPRWDLFSMAATLAHLASGIVPFGSMTMPDRQWERSQGRAREHMHLDRVPAGLREVLHQCLEEGPDGWPEHYPTLDEVMAKVESWAKSLGV